MNLLKISSLSDLGICQVEFLNKILGKIERTPYMKTGEKQHEKLTEGLEKISDEDIIRLVKGGGKFGTLNEVIEKLDTTYPRFGKSLTFSDIINEVSDGIPFNVNMLTRLSQSQDVIKKSLNKLEKWEVLLSNNSKCKINKVWYINPNLKTNGGDKI